MSNTTEHKSENQGFTLQNTENGLLPKDWEAVKLRKIANCQGGYAFSPDYQGKSSGDYPFYKVSDMNLPGNETLLKQANNYITKKDSKEMRVKTFRSGSVVFPKVGGAVRTNKKRLLSQDAVVDNNVMAVWVKDQSKCLDEYLFNFFLTLDLINLANPGTLPYITNSRVMKQIVPVPPLTEQRRIAHALRIIQDAIAAQEDVIAAARELKRSLMERLFTYGPNAEPQPTKETEIGEIPEHWIVKPFGEVATLQRGKDLPKRDRNLGPYPVGGSNGIVDYHNEFVAEPPGVLVGRSGSVGKVTWISTAYWPLNTSLWVKNFHGNDPLFIYYLLSNFDFRQYTSGVSVPTLNRNLVHPVKIGIPSIQEQKQISKLLSVSDAKINVEKQRKAALEELFRSTLEQLMTGQIRLTSDIQ